MAVALREWKHEPEQTAPTITARENDAEQTAPRTAAWTDNAEDDLEDGYEEYLGNANGMRPNFAPRRNRSGPVSKRSGRITKRGCGAKWRNKWRRCGRK